MSDFTFKYLIEEDGVKQIVHYVKRSCCCFSSCNDDELLIWDEGERPENNDTPYRLNIQGN